MRLFVLGGPTLVHHWASAYISCVDDYGGVMGLALLVRGRGPCSFRADSRTRSTRYVWEPTASATRWQNDVALRAGLSCVVLGRTSESAVAALQHTA